MLGNIKSFVIYSIAILWLSLGSIGAYAKEDEVLKFINTISEDAFSIMNAPHISDTEKMQKLTNLFNASVDIKWISRFVLGRYWKQLSVDKKVEYMGLFERFLINQYIPKFKQYNHTRHVISKVATEGNEEYSVFATIATPNMPVINIEYKIHKSSDKYKIYDVVAEGISLLNTERAEFSSIIAREGIDSFMILLYQKVNIASTN